MTTISRRTIGRRIAVVAGVAAALLWGSTPRAVAADDGDPPKGPTVTVLKAGKSCFSSIVEVFGVLIPREEVSVRPDRQGLKVADAMVEAGDTVASGQALARLSASDGAASSVTAPVSGLISASTAVVGAPASGKGEALFSIIARNEFDLVGQVPVRHLSKLVVNQPATVRVLGAEDIAGRVRRIAATVEPNSQLGQVFISVNSNKRLLSNAYGRATIKIGESCGVSVPLTAVLYSPVGTVVQVVRRQQIETRRVELGLMSGGQVEIREGVAEGDVVVARAGSLLREGDPVRTVDGTQRGGT